VSFSKTVQIQLSPSAIFSHECKKKISMSRISASDNEPSKYLLSFTMCPVIYLLPKILLMAPLITFDKYESIGHLLKNLHSFVTNAC
jgi:hypothetical protein